MWLALWEVTSVLYICPFFYRLYFGGYLIFMIAREDIESDARATKSRRKSKSKTKVKLDPKGGESSSSRPEPVGRATERRDQERKLRKKFRKIRTVAVLGTTSLVRRPAEVTS